MLGSDESLYLLNKISDFLENTDSVDDIPPVILNPVQCMEMSIVLYNMKNPKWDYPIMYLRGILESLLCFGLEDSFQVSATSSFSKIDEFYEKNIPYKTGDYYKQLDDNKTVERMKKDGKIK